MTNTALRKNQCGAETYEHCKNIFNILNSDRGKIEFDLKILKPKIACPTIIIIDSLHVLIGIIGEHDVYTAGKKNPVLSIIGAVAIDDLSGEAARHYIDIIGNLARRGTEITTFED